VEDQVIDVEKTAVVKYTVEKKPNAGLKVEWYKNDKVLTIDNTKYTSKFDEAENSFELSIASCNIKDAGKYTVGIANAYGKATADFRLLVKCKCFFLLKKILKNYLFSLIK